ncbi:hypothetical protein BKA80DRAFT_263468 [Phyllosticta citrichinensis]
MIICRTEGSPSADVESLQCDEQKPCGNCVRFGVPCDLAPGVVSDIPAVVQIRRGRGRPRKDWISTSTTPPSSTSQTSNEKSLSELLLQFSENGVPSPPTSAEAVATPESTTDTTALYQPPCATLPLINIDDAEPLLHFIQYTAATLPGKGGGGNMCRILRFWERNAPQIDLRWPFVQHLILSVAYFHLSKLALEQDEESGGHKKPDGDAGDPGGLRHPLLRRTRDEYLALAQHHFSSGLAGFTCLMAHPDTSNCGALYLSAVMVSYCTFAAGPTSANDLLVCCLDDSDGSEDHQSILFVHGLRIIYASSTPEVLFAGLLAPLGPSGKGASPEPPLPFCIRDGFKRVDWEPALNELRGLIGQSSDQEGFAACVGALDDLATTFAANYGCGSDGSYHGEPSNQFVFGWLYRIRNDFVSRVCARDPRALLLVAYYAVLLDSSTTVPQGWYIQRWSRHLVARVGEMLPKEPELEERMRWPREMTALEVCDSGSGM